VAQRAPLRFEERARQIGCRRVRLRVARSSAELRASGEQDGDAEECGTDLASSTDHARTLARAPIDRAPPN
jgi:uncharacterized protein YciW